MPFCYYSLEKIDGTENEKWTFSTREKAIEFLEEKICWGCRQDLKNKIKLEENIEKQRLDSVVFQNVFDTDCGQKYRLTQIDEEYYKQRLEKAMQEMAEIFEQIEQPIGYVQKDAPNENLSQENDQPNRMD